MCYNYIRKNGQLKKIYINLLDFCLIGRRACQAFFEKNKIKNFLKKYCILKWLCYNYSVRKRNLK